MQMAGLPPRQIVRLTRCLGVRGHPAMLIAVMSHTGYRWYPEYTVEEEFLDFNQTQYRCIIKIYPHYLGVTEPIHYAYGVGVTVDMAVQDAAYSCLTLLREEHPLLQETPFRYIPAALPGEEGYFTGLYTDYTLEDPRLQATAQFARNRDRDARALRFELHSTRARLMRALTLLAPFVSVGSLDHDEIYPVRTQMPTRVAWPEVGGIIPPRGPLLPPYTGPRPHPCSNGYQGPQASVFPDGHLQLPGYMGNFYEDYYGDA